MSHGLVPGQWGLVRTSSFVGWCIREGTNRPIPFTGQAKVNHAFVYIGEDDPRGNIVEMDPSGAAYSHWQKYGAVYWSTYIPPLVQQKAIVAAAKSLEARKCDYSFLDIGAISLKILGIVPPGLNEYITSTHHMICSQSVDWCCQEGGEQLFNDGRLPGMVTPEDLFPFTTGVAV